MQCGAGGLGPERRELEPLPRITPHDLLELRDHLARHWIELLRCPRRAGHTDRLADVDAVVARTEPRRKDRNHRRAREAREHERAGGKRSRRAEERKHAYAAGPGRAVELDRDDLVALERADQGER